MATVSWEIQMCAVPSHPMGCFPWDSHRNVIPMDKPGKSSFYTIHTEKEALSGAIRKFLRFTFRWCYVFLFGWFYLAVISIPSRKNKLVQGRQEIERTGRLSSGCPSTVE